MGRSRRAASRALAPHAAGALSCLLLIASVAPAGVSASGGPASQQANGGLVGRSAGAGAAHAVSPTGLPGGASSATATALKNGVSYRGQVAPRQQSWYELQAEYGERMYVQLWGRTPSCPVRMTLLDAHGRAVGEIVSTTREIEPFIVYYPKGDTSPHYYLRIQQGPSATPCASAAYVFTLQEPEQEQAQEQEQPGCESASAGEPHQQCPLASYGQMGVKGSKEEAGPRTYEAHACSAASRTYNQLQNELARERAGSVRRRLEAEIGAASRAVHHGCRRL